MKKLTRTAVIDKAKASSAALQALMSVYKEVIIVDTFHKIETHPASSKKSVDLFVSREQYFKLPHSISIRSSNIPVIVSKTNTAKNFKRFAAEYANNNLDLAIVEGRR